MRQDIEVSVIGGLLLGGLTPAASDVLARMKADAFTIPLYRKAFEVIRKQARNRNLIDALMVAEECGNEHATDIMMTARSCPSAANLRGYADMLAEQHQKRLFLSAIDEIKGQLSSATLEASGDAMDELIRRLGVIRKPKGQVALVLIGDVMDDYAETLERCIFSCARSRCGALSST